MAWSDTASGLVFRRQHLAASYREADIVPFEQFPYNGYDVLEPAIDFEQWVLTVGGAVARPGKYTLDQIERCRRPRTTHVMCALRAGMPVCARDGQETCVGIHR